MYKKIAGTLMLFSTFSQTAGAITFDEAYLGLYPAKDFSVVTGNCQHCKTIPQALWYFKNETIAVPQTTSAIASADRKALPPLIWLGSNHVLNNAKLAGNGQNIQLESGNTLDFAITPKIPTNLSYWDNSTLAFFQQNELRLRGEEVDGKFVARTVWPQNFKLDLNAKLQPLQAGENLKSLVQFENGGAKSAYQNRLIWGEASKAQGKAVIAFMLNGAQGDDDEAHGGHFAVATGHIEQDGGYSNWLVNNYYNLAAHSEKGIIAAITPMDKYLADLNNGQSFYRPSYMLVAILKNESTAAEFQSATNRVFNHFYRNDFIYDHSRNNCAGLSMDTLRNLGWHIPIRGVESQLKATAAYFYVAASERSLH